MNKAICVIGLVALLAISIVSAKECMKPVQRVDWLTYAQDKGYNLEGDVTLLVKKFSNMCLCYERPGNMPDVYGIVLSRWDGDFCFTGGNTRKPSTTAAVVPIVIPEPACETKKICGATCDEYKETCYTNCHGEKICNKYCVDWRTDGQYPCKEYMKYCTEWKKFKCVGTWENTTICVQYERCNGILQFGHYYNKEVCQDAV